MMGLFIYLTALLRYAGIGFGLYWIIRLGVRHGLRDHDREKESGYGPQ